MQAIFALLADVEQRSGFEEIRDGFPADEDYDQFFELVGVDEAFEEQSGRDK